jgi:hypothetical protein
MIENSKNRARGKDSLTRHSSEGNRSSLLLQEPLISDGQGASTFHPKKDRMAGSFMIQDQSSSANPVNHLQLGKLAVEKHYSSHGGGGADHHSAHQISGERVTSKGG